MWRWKALFFSCFLMVTASGVYAQKEYEVTPFFGTRFGGNIDLSQQGNPDVDFLKIKSSKTSALWQVSPSGKISKANLCGTVNRLR